MGDPRARIERTMGYPWEHEDYLGNLDESLTGDP